MSYRANDDSRMATAVAPYARAVLGAAMAAMLVVLAAPHGRATESWRILLAHQLKEQQRCTLAEVLFVREVKVGGRVGMEGRIRCTDTREYDFTREQENQRFTLRKCEPVSVC